MKEEIDKRILEKKDKFFKEIYENLSKDQKTIYTNNYHKFWGAYSKIWGYTKEIKTLKEVKVDLVKQRDKSIKWNLFFAAGITLVSFVKGTSPIEFGLIFLFFFCYFIWISILSIVEERSISNEISHIKRTISIFEVHNAEFNLIFLPNMEDYMTLYDEDRILGADLSSTESAIVSEFKVEVQLALIQNMGFDRPYTFN